MIPPGLAVLAIDVPPLRRARRRLLVKLEKRRRRRKGDSDKDAGDDAPR